MTTWAILPAAGIGRRMRAKIPKQYLNVNGRPIIATSLARIGALSYVEKLVVMLNPDDKVWPTLGLDAHPKVECREGGENRYQSVLNGLHYLADFAQQDDWILVHDAARPCVRLSDIDKLFRCLRDHPIGGLLGVPVDNTLKLTDQDSNVIKTIDRINVWSALTPQVFRFGILLEALEAVDKSQKTVTDEATAVENLGYQPQMIHGNRDNIKITQPQDLSLAEQILSSQALEE